MPAPTRCKPARRRKDSSAWTILRLSLVRGEEIPGNARNSGRRVVARGLAEAVEQERYGETVKFSFDLESAAPPVDDAGRQMNDAALGNSTIGVTALQREAWEEKFLAELRHHWETFGGINDKNIFTRIGFSSDEFFERILAEHPAKKLADNVENARRVFSILSASRSELIDLAGQFHYRVLHNPHDEHDLDAILRAATKEVYTYSGAAEALVQAYHHMVPSDSKFSLSYKALRAEIIGDSNVIRFFKDLRNSNNHIHILEATPHYSFKQSFAAGTTEVTSELRFNSHAILNGERFTQQSKSMAIDKEHLPVIPLVNEHFEIASQFYNRVLVKTGIHRDALLRDFARIKVARKSMSYRNALAILLQIAVPQKLNPYEYLHAWFTEDELKHIYAFPDHSKEQLEYMISLRDPLQTCDATTRKELYKLFSVSEQ
jgi:hypothetical protein